MRTMDEVFDRFTKEHLPRLAERTGRDYARHVEKLRKFFGRKAPKDLTRGELTAWMKVEKGKTNRNRILAVLSSALGDAVNWGWIDYNVCKEIERHPQNKRARIVTNEELEGIKRRAGKRMAAAIDLAILTGLKQSAILNLTWDQVYLDKSVIRVKHHLTNQAIQVPITPQVRAALVRCKGLSASKRNKHVLQTQYGQKYTSEGFRAGWQRLIGIWERAGNERFTFNDIQKTWAHRNKQTQAAPNGPVDDAIQEFPQFDAVVRTEATRASQHYKVFYCLEQSIRKLIINTMENTHGVDWWNSSGKVNQQIKQEVDNLVSKEIDAGMTQRSERMIDYTTFGQLGQIIVQNWEGVFEKQFKSRNAVGHVMASLNRIRGPIAHCSPMSEREVKRLALTVEDWFSILLPQ